MRFFEEMDPLDRKIMLLKAVRHSVAMEGMKETTRDFTKEISNLERKASKTTLRESDRTTE